MRRVARAPETEESARRSWPRGNEPQARQRRRPQDDTPRCNCPGGHIRQANLPAGPFHRPRSSANARFVQTRQERFDGLIRRRAYAGSRRCHRIGLRRVAPFGRLRSRSKRKLEPASRVSMEKPFESDSSDARDRSSVLLVRRRQPGRRQEAKPSRQGSANGRRKNAEGSRRGEEQGKDRDERMGIRRASGSTPIGSRQREEPES